MVSESVIVKKVKYEEQLFIIGKLRLFKEHSLGKDQVRQFEFRREMIFR